MGAGVLTVLGTDPTARHVAGLLGLRVSEPDEPALGRLLVVVHRPEAIDAAAKIAQVRDVAGIIAWSLPESAALRCFDLGPPVVIGLPNPDELRALAWWGESSDPSVADRERTERLAHLESAF